MTGPAAIVERVRAGIGEVRRHRYPGSGAGRPRVPHDLPRRLAGLESGLQDIAEIDVIEHPATRFIAESAWTCTRLVERLTRVCDEIREPAPGLADRLRAEPDRVGVRYDLMIDERLREGLLPFSNGEICPVGTYGAMEAWKFGNPRELDDFAATHLHRYEELDESGVVVMDWAGEISRAAQEIVGRAPFKGPLIQPHAAQ